MFLDKIALTLAIIGGLNWGSVGLVRWKIPHGTEIKIPGAVSAGNFYVLSGVAVPEMAVLCAEEQGQTPQGRCPNRSCPSPAP